VTVISFSNHYHTDRWIDALQTFGFQVIQVQHPTEPGARSSEALHGLGRFPGIPMISAATAWRRAIAQTRPDVVLMLWAFARPGMLAALRDEWPLVLTVYGDDVRQDRRQPESLAERTWRRALLVRADVLTAAARPLARVIEGYHPALRDRVHLVPFGVDTAVFHPGPARGDGPVVIGHFKGDAEVSGRIDLLVAFERLLRAGVSARLLFAGVTGNLGSPCGRFLADHPEVAASVEDVGRVPLDTMPALYRRVDIYVAPSRRESFGAVLAEALATEVPAVAYHVGGVDAIVTSGEGGVLVRPNDADALTTALYDLATDPARRAKLGKRGREFVAAHFEWRDCVGRMARCLQDAADRRATRTPLPLRGFWPGL